MLAKQENLYEFISAGKRTFSIPVYQRNYDWRGDECSKLFSDIEAAVEGNRSHFVGTIVYVASTRSNATWNEYSVIDGQQRITSVMLLLKAIYDVSDDEEIKEEIWERFLTNKFVKEEKYRLKLKPIGNDSATWEKIIEGENLADSSSRLWKNYVLFRQKLSGSPFAPHEIFGAIGRLGIVYIQLEAGLENPQVIFESINSTGLNLTQGDLIRNYLLMNCPSSEKQTRLYKDYWVKIEDFCTPAVVPDFVRDYLTMTNHSLTNKKFVYEVFKRHAQDKFSGNEENLLAELLRYAEYYSWFKFCQSGDKKLNSLLRQFHDINSFVAFSPLLWFFDKCFHKKTLSNDGLVEVIKTLLSYQYRRLVCKYSTNALNAVYVALPKEIGEIADMPKKLLEILAGKKRTQTFPRNDEFCAAFSIFDMYTPKLAKYTLAMLENYYNPKEKVELTEQITIEHVMPQTLSAEWKAKLGKGFEQVHSQWLHTIGNLTLSGNNSILGNESYSQKRAVYENSNVYLSRKLAEAADSWGESSIKQRAHRLAEAAAAIWHIPDELDKNTGDADIDYDLQYSFMEHVRITGEKPRSFIFGGEEKFVDSWTGMFVDVLAALHEFDSAIYRKLITHEVMVNRHLAEPIGTDYQFRKKPVEICPGYLTETHFSSQELMAFMQVAIEFYELQDEFLYTLKRKSS